MTKYQEQAGNWIGEPGASGLVPKTGIHRTGNIVLFRGWSLNQFRNAAKALGEMYRHPDAGDDGLTHIKPDNRSTENGTGFTRAGLAPHTDRAGTPNPPTLLAMYYPLIHPSQGGVPLFCDLELVLSVYTDQELSELSIRSRHGLESFPILIGYRGGRRAFRYRDDDAFELDGPMGLVDDIRAHVRETTFAVSWLEAGGGYIIDNTRMLHGRTQILGEDRIGIRALINEQTLVSS